MRIVVIESPFGSLPDGTRATPAQRETHVKYAQACLLDCLRRGEAPYASHLLYPQCLEDDLLEERAMGMRAGFAFYQAAALSVVYTDYGMTSGMREGVRQAILADVPVEFRRLGAT